MKEPTREEWAEDFLNNAHDELNAAALQGELSNQANEARFLIGQALTLARNSAEKGALGRWPEETIAMIRKAQQQLRDARWTPKIGRASQLCNDAVRLIEEGGKLKPEFASQAKDREAAVRFFGRVKIANEGRGHGVPLKKPLKSAQKDTERKSETAVNNDDADKDHRNSWRRNNERGFRR